MAKRYIYVKTNDEWSAPSGLRRAMEAAEKQIQQGTGPFKLLVNGDLEADSLTRSAVLEKLQTQMKNRPVGASFRVRKHNDNVVYASRSVMSVSSVDSTSGNSNCDVYWNWVRQNFKAYDPRYAGAYVCKTVAGSTVLSQHSYGNAVDVFFDTFDHQDKVARAVEQNAKELSVYHIISGQSIWTRGVGWTGYRGEFHRHLHVDFAPQYEGPCGVKP